MPGLALMATAHLLHPYATVAMTTGAAITGFTVLSSFPAVRVYLSEQFPTELRGRGHFFGEAILVRGICCRMDTNSASAPCQEMPAMITAAAV